MTFPGVGVGGILHRHPVVTLLLGIRRVHSHHARPPDPGPALEHDLPTLLGAPYGQLAWKM